MQEEEFNPFQVYDYLGPDYFCDRKKELGSLVESFNSHRHLVLYSRRRLGKTGLLHHFHHTLRRKKVICVYVDVMDTTSDQEFVNKLITETVAQIESKNANGWETVKKFFGSLQPTISLNPITGEPKMSLRIETKEDIVNSLSGLLDLIGSYTKLKFQIAIDEFQQIASYETPTVIDATLRGFFHKAPNVHFLFSGSQEHILLDLFGSAKRPLYASVSQLKLEKIEYKEYFDFIKRLFSAHHKVIEKEVIDELIQWTELHTYYTQSTSNKLFGVTSAEATPQKLYQLKNSILLENEPYYLQIRAILSKIQYRLLCAIAMESTVINPTSTEFLTTYGLNGSSVLKAMSALRDYDLVYTDLQLESTNYRVNDVFFYHWLREKGYYANKVRRK